MVKWCKAMQRKDTEIIVSIDSDDTSRHMYITIYGKPFYEETGIHARVIMHSNRSSVAAINAAASETSGRWMIVVSDDSECMHHWDNKICLETDEHRDWILKTQDGIQPWIITMPVMDRTYYSRFGYIYHPDYKHLFCDTELTCVADITGRKITSNLLFPHNHYSIGKSVKDEISIRADATQQEGERLFIERYKRNFDLPPGNKIQDKGLIDWLLKRNVHA